MKGEKENVNMSDDGSVLLVNRGKKGAAIINLSTSATRIDLPTTIPDGKYKDEVYGKEFKVKKGRLTGLLAPERSYILIKK